MIYLLISAVVVLGVIAICKTLSKNYNRSATWYDATHKSMSDSITFWTEKMCEYERLYNETGDPQYARQAERAKVQQELALKKYDEY